MVKNLNCHYILLSMLNELKKKISPTICVVIHDRPLKDMVVARIPLDFGQTIYGKDILQISDTLRKYGFDDNFVLYGGDCDILEDRCIPADISFYGDKNKISKELLKKLKENGEIIICGERKSL